MKSIEMSGHVGQIPSSFQCNRLYFCFVVNQSYKPICRKKKKKLQFNYLVVNSMCDCDFAGKSIKSINLFNTLCSNRLFELIFCSIFNCFNVCYLNQCACDICCCCCFRNLVRSDQHKYKNHP